MSSPVRTSRKGLQLIKSFEGFRPNAARLPDGRWTIGYGHVRSAQEGGHVSEEDAEHLLRYDLKRIEAAITEWTLTPLNQNEFDALVSLVFNISPGQFRDSEILRRLNAGDHIAAAHAFDAWRRARINGRLIVVDALVRRRTAEKALFLEPMHRRPAAPTPIITPELDVSLAVCAPKRPPVSVSTDLTAETAEAVADLEDPFQDERALGEAVADLAAASADRHEASAANDPKAAAEAVSARIAAILRDQPVEPTEASAAEADKPRILIDDTEVIDPGIDKAVATAIGREDDAEDPFASSREFFPWGVVALLALILMMIGGGDVARLFGETPQDASSLGALAFLAGLLTLVMGLYFWMGRRWIAGPPKAP